MAPGRMSVENILERMKTAWPETHSVTLQVMLRVYRLRDLARATVSEVLGEAGLTHSEFEVLMILRVDAPISQLTPTELYKGALMTSGGLTKTLDNLERKGLVDRPAHDGDRRVRPVRLTESGATLAEETLANVEQREAALLRKGLTEQEMVALAGQLQKLLIAVE